MFKRIFFHGLAAGILSAIAAAGYNRFYIFATETDFSKVLNYASLTGLSLAVCMVATFLYYGLTKWLPKRGEIVFNFIFSIASFACVIIPIAITLPLNIESPELFPGLAAPMVFFPAIAWYTLRPLFEIKN
ncbi:MAG TPA: hypothetical protein VK668_01580 [Mucilaginibacter sp.]|nr:hypothetical protein [Mucilaginibacter sp.]